MKISAPSGCQSIVCQTQTHRVVVAAEHRLCRPADGPAAQVGLTLSFSVAILTGSGPAKHLLRLDGERLRNSALFEQAERFFNDNRAALMLDCITVLTGPQIRLSPRWETTDVDFPERMLSELSLECIWTSKTSHDDGYDQQQAARVSAERLAKVLESRDKISLSVAATWARVLTKVVKTQILLPYGPLFNAAHRERQKAVAPSLDQIASSLAAISYLSSRQACGSAMAEHLELFQLLDRIDTAAVPSCVTLPSLHSKRTGADVATPLEIDSDSESEQEHPAGAITPSDREILVAADALAPTLISRMEPASPASSRFTELSDSIH